MTIEKPLIGKVGLNFQVDQLTRVAIAMRGGDVSECKNNELMHAVDVLALLIGIDEIAPGVMYPSGKVILSPSGIPRMLVSA